MSYSTYFLSHKYPKPDVDSSASNVNPSSLKASNCFVSPCSAWRNPLAARCMTLWVLFQLAVFAFVKFHVRSCNASGLKANWARRCPVDPLNPPFSRQFIIAPLSLCKLCPSTLSGRLTIKRYDYKHLAPQPHTRQTCSSIA